MQKSAAYLILLLVILALHACSDFRRVQRSTDPQEKYESLLKYYEEEDYYRTLLLMEDVMPYYRGKPEMEKLQFYYAYAHYYQKQYLMSSHYFKSFFDTYNRSDWAEEAYYMYAYSLFMQSPPYTLDQESTRESIEAMQAFMNRFPSSERIEEAGNIINELRAKLEKKAFEKATNYYNLGMFRSALVAFENFSRDFPDSDYNEDIGYFRIATEYEYAKRSVSTKQTERYRECLNFYQEFVEDYPQSRYIRELKEIYDDCLNILEKLDS